MLNTTIDPRVQAAMDAVEADDPSKSWTDISSMLNVAIALIRLWEDYDETIEDAISAERFILSVCLEECDTEEIIAMWQAKLENDGGIDYANSYCDRLRNCVPDGFND